ncbi:uncharacterized protein VDAG_03377 [Verticillium dahliae VdLs.17]|uniref:Uncharacterized protein n=1 Tax=Verticillium dahliae (strain VdLs.17 / ATCC MYA-4575 / FGSC 10137) TaxID=498257 RepID=G2WZD5_VERDV|nr:uncharacterized protein VDAG_03377 [Verticillium dahliae VdLs.17]EGY21937.1 hypothetical protein VDAG_03377 [Verticillium dahliae VdLs.17]
MKFSAALLLTAVTATLAAPAPAAEEIAPVEAREAAPGGDWHQHRDHCKKECHHGAHHDRCRKRCDDYDYSYKKKVTVTYTRLCSAALRPAKSLTRRFSGALTAATAARAPRRCTTTTMTTTARATTVTTATGTTTSAAPSATTASTSTTTTTTATPASGERGLKSY